MVVNILVHERILNDEEVASNFEFLGKIKHPNLVEHLLPMIKHPNLYLHLHKINRKILMMCI
jgi:hypothetical protein